MVSFVLDLSFMVEFLDYSVIDAYMKKNDNDDTMMPHDMIMGGDCKTHLSEATVRPRKTPKTAKMKVETRNQCVHMKGILIAFVV
jgi:hypothetical protein